MRTVIKHNSGSVYGVEAYVEGVTYPESSVVVDGVYALDFSKDTTVDVDTGILTSVPKPPREKTAEELRTIAVEAIVVTTGSGKEFDGDESSQSRMSRAIQASETLGQTETLWKLADNSPASVTVDELKEALALALQEQSKIWMA